MPFVYSCEWDLPTTGVFEFDFVYLDYKPLRKNEITEEELVKLKNYFENETINIDEKIQIFKQIAEYITLSSSQLAEIIEFIDDDKWKVSSFLSGISRLHDLKDNHDFIKLRC